MLISESASCEFVCGVESASDSEDDLVTSEYQGLRDVDGWQRKHPRGGSAEARPKRANSSSTLTFISTLTSTFTFSYTLIYTPSSAGLSKTSALTESGKVPPSTDEPGESETLSFPTTVLDMTEADIVALEERVRKVGGTNESPFAKRSPFESAISSLSPYTSFTFQSISSAPHIPHITGSKYFNGCGQEEVAEKIDESPRGITCRDTTIIEETIDESPRGGRTSRDTTSRAFHLCKEYHDVPEQDQERCTGEITEDDMMFRLLCQEEHGYGGEAEQVVFSAKGK